MTVIQFPSFKIIKYNQSISSVDEGEIFIHENEKSTYDIMVMVYKGLGCFSEYFVRNIQTLNEAKQIAMDWKKRLNGNEK